MAVIDSDAHVLEIEHTWDFLDESEQQFRPALVSPAGKPGQQQYWLIDGRVKRAPQPKQTANINPLRHGDHIPTPDESRFMLEVGARVRHMDELGTDVQVLYPTLFIEPITERPDVELALSRSYNRWLAEIWAEGKGRLRWAAVPPLLSMDLAREELRFAKDHGACAIFMRGLETGDRRLSDPYLFPLYEEASDLDLPICIHTGNGSRALMDLSDSGTGFTRFKLVGVDAFHNVLYHNIPDRFPKLRFGFVELSSQWVPYVLHDLRRRVEQEGRSLNEDILRDNHVYVACQTDDDLLTVIRYVGDDNLVIGTDYGHTDTSSELHALQRLQDECGLPPESARKIVDDNARVLYGL